MKECAVLKDLRARVKGAVTSGASWHELASLGAQLIQYKQATEVVALLEPCFASAERDDLVSCCLAEAYNVLGDCERAFALVAALDSAVALTQKAMALVGLRRVDEAKIALSLCFEKIGSTRTTCFGRCVWINAVAALGGVDDAEATTYAEKAVKSLLIHCSKMPLYYEDAVNLYNRLSQKKHVEVPIPAAIHLESSVSVKDFVITRLFQGKDTDETKASTELYRAYMVPTRTPVRFDCSDMFYFEITVLKVGIPSKKCPENVVGIGVCPENGSFEGMPGWTSGYGFHADDGLVHQFTQKQPSRQQLVDGKKSRGVGRVLGCYWSKESGVVGFTLDGKYVGNVFKIVKGPLFPVVGLRSPGSSVKVNYGCDIFSCNVHLDWQSLQLCEAESLCSRVYTSDRLVPQHWAQCLTCHQNSREGLCLTCIKKCHAGHVLSAVKFSLFFCDCEEGSCLASSRVEMLKIRAQEGDKTSFYPLFKTLPNKLESQSYLLASVLFGQNTKEWKPSFDEASVLEFMCRPDMVVAYGKTTQLYLHGKKHKEQRFFADALALDPHAASAYELGMAAKSCGNTLLAIEYMLAAGMTGYGKAMACLSELFLLESRYLSATSALYWNLRARACGQSVGDVKLYKLCGNGVEFYGAGTRVRAGKGHKAEKLARMFDKDANISCVVVSGKNLGAHIVVNSVSELRKASNPSFNYDGVEKSILANETFKEVRCGACKKELFQLRAKCIDCNETICVGCFVCQQPFGAHLPKTHRVFRAMHTGRVDDWSRIVEIPESNGDDYAASALSGEWKGSFELATVRMEGFTERRLELEHIPFECVLTFDSSGGVVGSGITKDLGGFKMLGKWKWKQSVPIVENLVLTYNEDATQPKAKFVFDGVYSPWCEFRGVWGNEQDCWLLRQTASMEHKHAETTSVFIQSATCKVLNTGSGNVTFYENYTVQKLDSESLVAGMSELNARIKHLTNELSSTIEGSEKNDVRELLEMFEAELAIAQALNDARCEDGAVLLFVRQVLTKVKVVVLWCRAMAGKDMTVQQWKEQLTLCAKTAAKRDDVDLHVQHLVEAKAHTFIARNASTNVVRACGKSLVETIQGSAADVTRLKCPGDALSLIAEYTFCALLGELCKEVDMDLVVRPMSAILSGECRVGLASLVVNERIDLVDGTSASLASFLGSTSLRLQSKTLVAPSPYLQAELHGCIKKSVENAVVGILGPKLEELSRSVDSLKRERKRLEMLNMEEVLLWLKGKSIPESVMTVLQRELIDGAIFADPALPTHLEQLGLPYGMRVKLCNLAKEQMRLLSDDSTSD